MSPEAVVQRQLDAYNARDIDALIAIYTSEAELFEFPSKLLAHGSEQLRQRFITRFQESNLHARLIHRMVSGSLVIDHECVTRTFEDGPGEIDVVMIYEVAGDCIAKSWSIPGEKRIFTPRSQSGPTRT